MLEQIIAQPAWFWLCLGGLLLIAELLGAGVYTLVWCCCRYHGAYYLAYT